MLLDHRGATQVWEKLVNLLVPDVDPQLVQLDPRPERVQHGRGTGR